MKDAKDGFWQVKLTERASYLTTFNTPYGRFRWKRMPFGICSASEEFQRRINDAIGDIEGVQVIVDDILIYGKGKNYDEAVKDHDRKLIKLLERLREKNIKLNESKVKLRLDEFNYMGHLITKNGLKSDPKKVEAISNMAAPTNVK